MAPTKLEINLRRLLERCEAMASEYQDNKENISWRLDKVNPVNLFKFFSIAENKWTSPRKIV